MLYQFYFYKQELKIQKQKKKSQRSSELFEGKNYTDYNPFQAIPVAHPEIY